MSQAPQSPEQILRERYLRVQFELIGCRLNLRRIVQEANRKAYEIREETRISESLIQEAGRLSAALISLGVGDEHQGVRETYVTIMLHEWQAWLDDVKSSVERCPRL